MGSLYTPQEGEVLMSWQEACSLILSGDLDALKRHPRCLDAYREWSAPIKKRYGSLEAYLRRERLGWPDAVHSGASTPNKETWPKFVVPNPNGGGLLRHFIEGLGEELVKCIPNDWPYAVPEDCTHYVVWSRLPILHPSLFSDEREAEAVTMDGVRGVTGQESAPISGPHSQALIAAGKLTPEQSTAAHLHAGRHVRAYVSALFPSSSYETAFFCNPPHLRTVPGLSHFHVLVRSKAQ